MRSCLSSPLLHGRPDLEKLHSACDGGRHLGYYA